MEKKVGIIKEWMLFVFASLGVFLPILFMFVEVPHLSWVVVLILVVITTIFMMIVSFYQGASHKEFTKFKKESMQQEQSLNHIIKELLDYYKHVIGSLDHSTSQIRVTNFKYSSANEKDSDLEKILIQKEMINEYNHFLRGVLSKLKIILDEWFCVKGLSLEVALSVKQFNRIVTDINNVSKVRIITTFRDIHTYTLGKREIGNEEYRINKNTAFHHCLRNKCFRANNIDPNADDYTNEHDRFEEFYNCTIVTPITCETAQKNIYGYLACDTLNDDVLNFDIFDDNMAIIMSATANIIGQYFDNMDSQWDKTFPSVDSQGDETSPIGFLGTIYQDKLVPKSKGEGNE